jgi:hypothetical protein
MARAALKPFFDELGNLVIPQGMLKEQPEATTITLRDSEHLVVFELSGRSIVSQFETTAADDCGDLVHAASSALGFWDNPEDAAAWNNYPAM